MAKYTKYSGGTEWILHEKYFKSQKEAKKFIDERKKKYRLKENNLYYRIKGKYNTYQVWYRVGKSNKHRTY